MDTQNLVVPIDKLVVASTNARKDTDAGQEDASLSGLAQSIREHGLLNPLTVRPREDGSYEILAGQRRYLACKQIGLPEIPVVVRSAVSDSKAVALSLIENVQRADMHPLDKAAAFDELKTFYGGNLRQVAQTTGVSVQTVQKYLLLLKLPGALKDELGTHSGSAGIGSMAALVRTFDDADAMIAAWNQIGGFTQDIQNEILKRSGGELELLPELVLQAQEGAFDVRRCGSSIEDCPHIPDELRAPLRAAMKALQSGAPDAAVSLRDFAARHKKKR